MSERGRFVVDGSGNVIEQPGSEERGVRPAEYVLESQARPEPEPVPRQGAKVGFHFLLDRLPGSSQSDGRPRHISVGEQLPSTMLAMGLQPESARAIKEALQGVIGIVVAIECDGETHTEVLSVRRS